MRGIYQHPPCPPLNSLKPQGAINPTLQRRKLSRGGNCQGHALGRYWGQDLAPGSVTTGPKLLTTKPCLSDEYRIPLPFPLSCPHLPFLLPSPPFPLGTQLPTGGLFVNQQRCPSVGQVHLSPHGAWLGQWGLGPGFQFSSNFPSGHNTAPPPSAVIDC